MLKFGEEKLKHQTELKSQLINSKIETIFDLENKLDTNNPTAISTYLDEIKQFLKYPEYDIPQTDNIDPDYLLYIKQTKLILSQKALILCKQFLFKSDEPFFSSYGASLDIKKDIEHNKHHLQSQMPNQNAIISQIENDIDIITDASVWMRRFSALAFGALLVISGLLIYKKYKK